MAGTLLLLHGVGCDGAVWDRVKALFEGADWAVSAPTLFPELRTRAEPPEALAALTLEDYLAEARRHAQEIAAREGRPPIVIGHSMGGLLAQHLVVSGHVRAGIFVTPSAPAGCQVIDLRPIRSFWGIGRLGLQKLEGRSWKLSRDGADFILSKRIPAPRRAAIYETLRYDSGRMWRDLFKPTKIDEAMVSVPTLTVGARKDRATVIGLVRKVAAKYARAPVSGQYVEYADNGHFIIDEPGTDRVVGDVLEWLSDKRV